MQAAVCYEFGQPLVIEELLLEAPREGEVRLRVSACAICHSDLSLVRGEWGGSALPSVAGHEAAGVVEATGPGVDDLAVGDHVVLTLVKSCGSCQACRAGHSVCCSARFALDGESRLRTRSGRRVEQGLGTGAFAEACVVHRTQLVRIPREIPLPSAALLGCGVITGFGSVNRVARIEPGSLVVVIGAGGVGLNAIQAAAIAGAARILAVDILDSKLNDASEFGATDTVNARHLDPVEEVMRLTAGHGAEHVFVAAGRSRAITQAVDMLSRYGSVVIMGMPPDDDRIFSVDAHTMTTGRKLLGSKLGDTCVSEDIPALMALYQDGRLKLDELVSSSHPLDEINAALESVARGGVRRTLIRF